MLDQNGILVVALGGNALIRPGQRGEAAEQLENLRVPLRQIARLSRTYRIVITHGNGPQVGNLLLQQESCDSAPKMPLEILVAQTQGLIESTLDSELMDLGVESEQLLVNVITYVVVDESDPAFQTPTKPIGPLFTAEEANRLPYATVKTSSGYRRVVASPRPVTIIEKREIETLIAQRFIVICCGGGGIPVIREGRSFCGVNAVIDKDLAAAKLADEIGAARFVIATDVPGVALDYGTDRERYLSRLTKSQVDTYKAAGHFPPGSMGPKIEACLRYVAGGKRRVARITSVDQIESAVSGTAGTEIRLR
jgi:carbamate kinase